MRNGLALVAMVAACGGGSDDDNKVTDAAVDTPAMVMPDAQTPLEGTWRDTFYMNSGSASASACTTAAPPTAVKVDGTTAAQSLYGGICKSDGTFTIEAPGDLGTYYLKVLSALYEVTGRTGIDLGTDRLGRNDIASVVSATLSLNVNNLQSWTSGDILYAFSANLGYRQVLSFNSGGPTTNATTLAGVSPWGSYKVDNSKADQLQVIQLGKHTTVGTALDYLSLDRAYNAPGFAMSNNTQHPLGGSFVTPDQSSLNLSIDVTSFNQFAASAAPTVSTKSLQGTAFAAVSTDVTESPPIFSFAQASDAVSAMNFGTVTVGDPFPASWKRYVKIQARYAVPYSASGATGELAVVMTRLMTKAAAEAGTVDAKLGPVTAIKLDGVGAMTSISTSTVPVVSWSAPTVGTPTDYEVQVYEAKTLNGTTLAFPSVLRLVTKGTSVRIPAGYLLGQRQYVFMVRARIREGVDVHDTPMRSGTQWSLAEALTAIVMAS